MQIVWRTLPKLALPAAIGLGAAYLVTSFVPRPAPNLRPPEELRAQGQAYGEESPVRIILERNVLKLESSLFYPLGQPPAPIAVPEAAPVPVPPANASAPTQAAFAQADISVTPQSLPAAAPSLAGLPQGASGTPVISASAPLSGGSSVQGLAVRPDAPASSPTSPPLQTPARPAEPPVAGGPAVGLAAKTQAATAPAKPAAKAPATTPAARPVPRPSLEGFRLVGVISGGERPLAMLQVDGSAVSLHLGQQVRGWTLISVESAQVLLQNGEDQRRLELGNPGSAQRVKTP
jgi:hypothetical protein